MAERVKVGVIGTGAISGAYLGMAKNFPLVEMAACADMNLDAARAKASEFGIPKVCTVDEIFADRSIEIVLNLTIPKAHVPVALRAIASGKHTYCEKPLGIDREEGRKLLDAAKAAKLRVGCAPDTFMGAGVQTARKVIDDGTIGRPVALTAFMMGRGHESWHPNPQFYYEKGGGPMFDMGPYYLTALLNLLGPVKRISGMSAIEIPDRVITSEPKKGTKISVETPDHICGLMEFEAGAIGTIIQSFATRFAEFGGPSKQPITIFGTEGTLRVPDPNQFDGPVHVRQKDEAEWREVPHSFVAGYGRSVGLADMAQAIRAGRKHRCSAEQSFTVLDLMQGFQVSSDSGRAVTPTTKYERPAPMPAHLPFGTLDD
jgi:predicted dehydrogenase